MQAGNITKFAHLSQFRDLKDFNNNVEQWMIDIKEEFTKSELIALKRLIRFSAKVPGICNAKIQTIVAATHDGTMGISRSTFERMLRKAKTLGLIEIHNTSKRGYQAHNVYVFIPYPVKEVVQSENIDVPIKANNPSKSINLLNNKRIGDRVAILDHTYVSNRVPQRFIELVKCFFDDAKIIEEYYRMYHISTYHLNAYDSDDLLDIGLDSFRQMIRALKRNKVRKNPYAYYYGVFQRKLDKLYYELIV
ncbi:hypothetical protein [Bacillus cereus]|uniref:Helix-turn-helix domain-containing protein n=1 Tax=Bacillus cereus TaxID=1396 RepID=A0A2B1KIR7_BACCE|nr:hypothetical protein [Bacillus cereus]PFN23378.1 hypothetical protein COJ50_17250 [Bacillus cereus]